MIYIKLFNRNIGREPAGHMPTGNLKKYDMTEKINRYHGHRFTFPTDFYVFFETPYRIIIPYFMPLVNEYSHIFVDIKVNF